MLLTILSTAAVTVLWIHSEPTNFFRHWLYKKVNNKEDLWHWRLINCSLCSGFWLGLLVTFDFGLAAIISILAEFIDKKLTEGGL